MRPRLPGYALRLRAYDAEQPRAPGLSVPAPPAAPALAIPAARLTAIRGATAPVEPPSTRA